MKTFPLYDLPVEIQDLIVSKMDTLSWMQYKLAIGESVSISISNKEWNDAKSEFSESSSHYSNDSYDMEKGVSSDEE